VDRPGRVELDALAARLARADAAGAGVKKAWDPELGGLLPQLEVPLIAGIEVLHRRMELGTLRPQLFDRTLQLLDGIRLPGIHRGEEGEALGMAFDDPSDEVVGEWRPVGGRFCIPGEQDTEDLLLGILDSELIDARATPSAADERAGRPRGSLGSERLCFFDRDWIADVDRPAPDHARNHAPPAYELLL